MPKFMQQSSRMLCALALVLLLGLFVLRAFSVVALGIALVLLLLGYVGYGCVLRLPAATAQKAIAALLALYFALLLCAGVSLAVEPAWDFGRVYAGALDIAENGAVTYTLQYFLESNNNFFVAYLLCYWFKITSLFGLAPLYAGILLNCIAIWVSVAVLVWVVCRAWGVQRGLVFLALCLCCVPLYSYASIFYTDTLSMPFVSVGLWLWQQCQKKPSLWCLVLLGINAFVGYQLKASVGILYVAIFIFVFAHARREWWGRCKQIAVVAVVILLLSFGYRMLLSATQVIDLTELDRYKLPYTHYVMMGLAGNGGYNADDYALSIGIEDLQTRKEVNVAQIQSRLSEYGVAGYLTFLAGKLEFTWLDGTYYAPWKLEIDPLYPNHLLSQILRLDGQYFSAYQIAALGGQLALLLLMLLAVVRCATPTTAGGQLPNAAYAAAAHRLLCLVALSVFGLFLFLLVWETRSRYLVNFIPLFLLMAQFGLAALPRHKAAAPVPESIAAPQEQMA